MLKFLRKKLGKLGYAGPGAVAWHLPVPYNKLSAWLSFQKDTAKSCFLVPIIIMQITQERLSSVFTLKKLTREQIIPRYTKLATPKIERTYRMDVFLPVSAYVSCWAASRVTATSISRSWLRPGPPRVFSRSAACLKHTQVARLPLTDGKNFLATFT